MTAVIAPLAITEPGVYELDDATYHRDPVPGGSLSSTGAKRLLAPSCPALYRWWADHSQPPKTEFDIGHAAHRLLLGVGPEITVIDADDWRTKAAREHRDQAYAGGWVPLLAADAERVHHMVTALAAHPVASALFDKAAGRPEQSLFWTDDATGVWRRARLDWLPDADPGRRLLVGDYKTTVCAEPSEFERSAYKYGYFNQAAWYIDAVTALGLAGDDPQFVWVAQEKEPPYLVSVTYADPVALRWAADRNRQAIDVFADCQRTGEWPGYGEDVMPLTLPGWVERRFLEDYR